MTTPLLPLPIFRAFTAAGTPLAGGLLYTYAAGTTTPQATYSDAAGSSPNANPVVLDSSGSAVVRLSPTRGYKFVLKDSGGTTQWTADNYYAYADSPTFSGTLNGVTGVFSGNVSCAAFTATGTTTGVDASYSGSLTVGGNSTVTGNSAVTGTSTLTGQVYSNGVSIIAVKTSDESKISSTTVANDGTLTISVPKTTGYILEALINVQGAAGGIQFDLNYSGAFTGSGVSWVGAEGRLNAAAVNFAGHAVNPSASSAGFVQGTITNPAPSDYIRLFGFLNVVSTGTLGFNWGQANNVAVATIVKRGSWLKITQAPSA